MHNLLPSFKQYLLSLSLGTVSRKLYTSDVRHFLLWLGESPTLDTLKTSHAYLDYLTHLRGLAVAPSMIKRTTASLRQFANFVSSTYDLPNPLPPSLSGSQTSQPTDLPASGKYIKYFTNYLNDAHLSPLTIKSYKSDVSRYVDWAGTHLLSSEMSELLNDQNITKYLNHLSDSAGTLPSTIERKAKSITRFKDWYTQTYAPTKTPDNNFTAKRSPDELQPLRERVVSAIEPLTPPDTAIIPVKNPNSRMKLFSLVPNLASASVRNFIALLVLLVFASALSIFSYRQFNRDVRLTAAFPSTPVTPNRQLSFQGRLENAAGTPITSATDMVFKLFTLSSGGTELYSSGTCSITPDADGVFSTQIGDTCGSAIASSVFTENQDVWLEVTIGSPAETLTPRQQIATVAYALNSETIQGFPISATVSAIRNTVVPMNQWGEIIVGEQSPRLTGVSGTFAISAPALTLSTTTGTNGNITLAPDGTGQVNLNGNTTSTNFFNVSNAQLTTGSLITGSAANNNTGFKLIDLLSGSSPTSKFSVDDSGNVILAGDLTISGGNITSATTFDSTLTSTGTLTANGTFDANGQVDLGDGGDAITINGSSVSIQSTGAGSDITLDAVDDIILTDFVSCTTLETDGSGILTCGVDDTGGSTNYWRLANGALSPINNTLDLLVGSDATSSARGGFIGIDAGNTPTATVSAGASGGAYLTATGNLATTANQSLTLGGSTTGNITLDEQTFITNHAAIGSGASIDQDVVSLGSDGINVLSVYEEISSAMSGDAYAGTLSHLLLNPSANTTSLALGTWSQVDTESTNANNLGELYSNFGMVYHQGSGTVTKAYGGAFQVLSNTSELITDAIGITAIVDNGLNNTGVSASTTKSGSTAANTLGLSNIISNTGVVTTGTDSTYGNQVAVTRTGATGGTINTYGEQITLTTDNAGSGTHTAYGLYIDHNNSADTNYAIYTTGGAASQFGGNIQPGTTDTYDLGTTALRFKDLYLGGETLHIGTSLTDEGTLSYTTSTNVLSLATDATGNGNITLAPGGTTALTASGNDLTAADAMTVTGILTANGTLDANGQVDLGDGGDAITINGSSVAIQSTGAGSDITLNAVDQIILTDFTGGGLGCSALETDSSGVLTCGTDAGGGGSSNWQENLGTLSPINSTWDVLVGGTATSSAKIGFININSGIPTINLANQASNIALGDATAGALQILEGANPYLAINTSNGTENISFGNTTTNPTYSFLGSGLTTLGGDLAISGGNITTALTADSTLTVTGTTTTNGTLTANGLVTLGDGGDTVAINSSDWDISTDGNLSNIGTIGMDGDLTLTQADPTISLVDSGGDDYTINVDANAFTIINGTDTRTELSFAGDGGIDLGDNTTTKTIDLGGVTASAADTINIATEATAADVITIGNNNASSTLALTGGTAWSIGTTGNFISNDLTVNGNTVLGNAITDTITFTGRVAQDSDLIPITTTGTNDLGSSALPWDNLYVNTIASSAYTSGSVIFAGTSGAFSQDNANFFWDDTNNRLGLGIAAPQYLLDVAGDARIQGATFTDDVYFANGTTYFVDASGNAKFLDLQVADTGNPGLTVGNGAIGFIKVGGSTISDNTGNLTLDSDSAAITFAADDTTLTATGLATIDTAATVAWDLTTLNATGLATLDSAATFAWDATTLNMTSLSTFNPADTLTLASTTITLNSNSTINGGAAANDDLTLQGTSNATRTTSYVLLQPTAGNVGVGTSGPDRKLDILDASNPQLRLTQADGTVYSDFQMNSSGDLVVNVDGVSNQLVLDNSGSVGIGTAAPAQELDVAGDIRLTGLFYDDDVTAGIALGDSTSTALSGFGASSLIGALNELKNVDKNSSHNDYLSWANHYSSRAEGSDLTDSEALNGLFFDTFADSTKIDATNSTSSGAIRVSDNSYRVGLMGGQTFSTAETDNDGQTYLGSNTVNDIYYYDRAKDSVPEVLVELGIDPNWYNGVTLSVATSSATYSQNGTIADKNPNLTPTYNGSLIKATGTDSTPRTIYITIKSPTTFDWTNYQGDAATGVTITAGTAQTLGATGVSVTFTAANYNVGDVFKIASWYIEPESATRGAKQQFPERSNVIATAAGVDIIDHDTQKLWMRFTQGTGYALLTDTNNDPSAASALNGEIYISENGSSGLGLISVLFNRDNIFQTQASARYLCNGGRISLRNSDICSSSYLSFTSPTIATNTVNDVTSAVIPNQPTQEVTVSGWGYIQGDATAVIEETVSLPYNFNTLPNITTSFYGVKASTAPNSPSDCTTTWASVNQTSAEVITNRSFLMNLVRQSGSTFGATAFYCYTWIATGTVSPKQFVAVATGATGADGGTTVINETDGVKADYDLGSHHANVIWQNKVALTENGDLYTGYSNSNSDITALVVHYGIHHGLSDASLAQYRNGSYLVGLNSNWSTTGPVIKGSATGTNQITSLAVTTETSTVNSGNNTIYVGTAQGLSVIQEYQGHANVDDGIVESSGSVKYYTDDYVTEEMFGDMRGMWPFNESSGSLADASIKANFLEDENAPTYSVSGVRGTALTFDNTADYLCSDADNNATCDVDTDYSFTTGSFTIGSWFKHSTTAPASGVDTIFSRRITATPAGGDGWRLTMDTSGLVQFQIDDAAGFASPDTAISTRSYADNQWHHAIAYKDGTSGIYLYIDGKLVGSNTAITASSIGDSSSILSIGAECNNAAGANCTQATNYWDGQLDELMITASIPTKPEQQILNMYQVGARALQSHGTGLGGGSADTNQELGGVSNNIGVASPDYNNQYLYVGSNHTTDGALSKIQLNSDTNIKTYDAGANVPTGGTTIIDDDINSLGVGYQLEAVGSAASGVKSMGPDNNSDNIRTSLYSKTQTLSSSTKFAYLWASLYKDSSDLDSNIIPYACNAYATVALCTSNSAWVQGTSIQVDSTMSPPEQEYSFAFPTAGSSLTFKFDFYRDASNDKANTYLTRYGATWGSSVGGADIAERYQSFEPAYPGDIVTIDSPVSDGTATVKLSRQSYDQKAIGVVTTNPGIVMDENLVDLNWNAASRNSPDRPAVALAGRVPVKVSTSNGPILVGDPLTTSNTAGVGIKATQAGVIIGKALEQFDCSSPTATPLASNPTVCEGKVLTFVNITHYEPIYYLSDAGDFIFTGTTTNSADSSASSSATLADSQTSSPIIKLVRVLADGTQEVVDRIGTFGSVIAGTIKGQNLTIDTVSPLASGSAITINGPVVIRPLQRSDLCNDPSQQGSDLCNPEPALIVEGEIEAATLSARVAQLDEIRTDKIVAGEIIADSITANSIIGLDARIASLSAGTSTQLTDSELESITDRIKSRLKTLSGVEGLAVLTGNTPTAEDVPLPEPSDTVAQLDSDTDLPDIASDSGLLASLSADTVIVNEYLAVIGTATITSLDVTDTFYAESITAKSNHLALQPLGGIINMASGTLIVDSMGQVAINGDLTVSGNILASSANLGSLDLGTPSATPSSALGQLLSIYNEQGQAVATIDASGSANLASVTTKLITIASANSDATTSSSLSTSVATNATAGEAVLVSPNQELTIESPFVTANSLVYLTPTGNTDNKVVFVKAKESCAPQAEGCTPSFTVGIDAPASTDISFNWWIIQLGQ